MKIEEILPPLPPSLRHLDDETDDAIAYGLACARAAAVAALDEAIKLIDEMTESAPSAVASVKVRRLRDTIAKGEA